jgi:hypothetical protein
MRQHCIFDFDELTASVYLTERGKGEPFAVYYLITLAPDRSHATIQRDQFPALDMKAEPIESRVIAVTQESLATMGGLNPLILWLARGMWGLPLEFTGQSQASQASQQEPEEEPEEEPEPGGGLIMGFAIPPEEEGEPEPEPEPEKPARAKYAQKQPAVEKLKAKHPATKKAAKKTKPRR